MRIRTATIAPFLLPVLLAGCERHRPPRPIPASGFGDIQQVTAAQLTEHVRSLTFDTSHTNGDALYVLVPQADGRLGVGPLARVEPEVGLLGASGAQLDSGRVIGRITLDAAYGSWPAGVVYIWTDAAGGSRRNVYLPAAADAPAVITPVTSHPSDVLRLGPSRINLKPAIGRAGWELCWPCTPPRGPTGGGGDTGDWCPEPDWGPPPPPVAGRSWPSGRPWVQIDPAGNPVP